MVPLLSPLQLNYNRSTRTNYLHMHTECIYLDMHLECMMIKPQIESQMAKATRCTPLKPFSPSISLPVNSVIHLWFTIISTCILPDATHTLQESAGNPGLVRKSLNHQRGVISPPHLRVDRPPCRHVTIQPMLI